MFTKALEVAKECLTRNMSHAEYVAHSKQSDLIEYVDFIIIDLDAYQRLDAIMKREYLK